MGASQPAIAYVFARDKGVMVLEGREVLTLAMHAGKVQATNELQGVQS